MFPQPSALIYEFLSLSKWFAEIMKEIPPYLILVEPDTPVSSVRKSNLCNVIHNN
jgi:hypothetical protein